MEQTFENSNEEKEIDKSKYIFFVRKGKYNKI